jgi:hypothetical protein
MADGAPRWTTDGRRQFFSDKFFFGNHEINTYINRKLKTILEVKWENKFKNAHQILLECKQKLKSDFWKFQNMEF